MFATTSDELLLRFRSEVDDTVKPYLWSDDDGYGYMTEGFDAFLKRADSKLAVLSLAFTAGEGRVPLPTKVLHIRHMRIVGGGEVAPAPMSGLSAPRDDYGLSLSGASAMFEGSGTPCVYVRDYDAKALRLVPIPAADGVLEVQCTTNIGVPMASGAPLPTTDSEELRLVLSYMKSLAYQKHDAETEDLVRARFYAEQFRAGVLDRDSRLRNFRRPPGAVQMQGW